LIVWVIAGLLGLATGLRIGWALVNKQSLVSAAMILALGSLGLVAALNWQPLTLLIDTMLRWPNVSTVFSQVALIACAAGSCVMITSASSSRGPATIRRIAIVQYVVAGVIAALTLVAFFIAPQQPEMAPEEYLRRNLGSGGTSLSWLLPLLYVLLALTLVAWAGARHSNRTRRGRALFLFTIGITLIVLASAFFLLRAAGSTGFVGVGAAATLLGCAMLVVASGSLLPSIEDWFGARRELRIIQPLLEELNGRHPNVGIGVRPRGPLLFRADVADLRRAVPGGHPNARRRGRLVRRLVGSGAALGLTGGSGATYRGVDPRRSRRWPGHGKYSFPRSQLAASAIVVLGSRVDPRDRGPISKAGAPGGRCRGLI
jgi:hypothetical protein